MAKKTPKALLGLVLAAALGSLAAAATPRQRFLRAVEDLHAQRFEQARAGLEAVLKEQPGQLEALYYLAQALYHLGRRDEAQARFQAAAALDPSMPVTHYYLGRIAYDRGDLPAAFEALRRADELDPELPMVHYYLGLVYQANRQPEPARLEFERALQLQPDLGRAALAAATLRQLAGQRAEALALLGPALKDTDAAVAAKARRLRKALAAP